MAITPTNDFASFDLEPASWCPSQCRNYKPHAISSAFVLGMMVATLSLLTVQHYGLGDASFTACFFAPAVRRMHPMAGEFVESVSTQVFNIKSHHLGRASLASIHHSIPTSLSQKQMSIALPDTKYPNTPATFIDDEPSISPVPPTHSVKPSAGMGEVLRADEPDNYITSNNAAVSGAELQNSPWSLTTCSLLAYLLLIIITGGLIFLQQKRQNGSMGGDGAPMGMMAPISRTLHRLRASVSGMRMVVDDEDFTGTSMAPPPVMQRTEMAELATTLASFGAANSACEEAWKQWEFEFLPDDAEDVPHLPEADHRAAVKALTPFVSEDLLAKMLQVLSHRTGEVRFAMEDPTDPGNVWACLRTLDSFGVQYVDVIANEDRPSCHGSVDRHGMTNQVKRKNKTMKTVLGSQRWLDMSLHDSTVDYVQQLKKDGWCVIATDLSPTSVPIHELNLSSLGPIAMVLGNERDGISNDMRELADRCVHLPTHGFAESLSLYVGCAVMLSHMNSCDALKHGTLPQSEKDRFLYEWLAKSITASGHILQKEGLITCP